ncbi:MAG: MFS transporter [Acidobacteriota bacterium]
MATLAVNPDAPSGIPPRFSRTSAYAAPAFALALFGVPVYVHLPKFYADTVGAPLALLGLAILATRLWDAVLDPAIGAWSDRVRSRWGRRRPFLFAAPVPLALAVVLLFSPPDAGDPVWWFGLSMGLGFLAWTAVQVPHAALGPEIVRGYHERTRVFAWRDGLWIAGTLAAAVAPAVARAAVGADGDQSGERAAFRAMGLAYAALLVALPWWCAASIEEPASSPDATPPRGAAGDDGAASPLRNRPFRILLAAYAVGAFGAALPGTLLLFYVEHVLVAPELADLFLALYFLAGFAVLPLWTAVARRYGKRETFLGATFLSIVVFSCAFLLGPGDVVAYGFIVVTSGACFGATLVLPSSMQADTIDVDEVMTGRRREGLYLGLWALVMKASSALGAGLALPILGRMGYVGGQPQTEEVVQAIRVLYCLVPCATYLIALAIAWRYPLDEATHARLTAGLAR